MSRSPILLGTAVVLASTPALLADDAVQWSIDDGGNGHWYELVVLESNPDFKSELSCASLPPR